MLGDSRKIAMRRWFALERRLQADQTLKDKYIEFMREFHRLGQGMANNRCHIWFGLICIRCVENYEAMR